jgi:hypothetical protein
LRTSVSNGDNGPVPIPERSSSSSATRAGPACASDSACGLPSWIVEAAITSAASAAPESSAALQRWRTTKRAHAVQPRLAWSVRRVWRRSRRGPIVASTTGSSVIATATLTSGISMPAMPRLRRNGTGSATSASSEMATVVPLRTTARPACSMAFTTASWSVAPRWRSSRQRTTTSSA